MDLIRAGMDGNTRFRSPGQAIAQAASVLGKHGLEWGEVIQSFRLTQPKGRMSIDIARQTDDPFSPIDIRNSALAFHWTTLETGIEVVAYLG